VVIGAAFTEQGYGKRPKVRLGDIIKIADFFNTEVQEKQVVGIASGQHGGFIDMNFYPSVITTSEAIHGQFDEQYINQFSNSEVLIKYEEGADIEEATKDLKRELIDYNIMQIFELNDLAKTAESFMESMILMFQAFLGFSLIVGASGLAIIVTRSVQERRQQIGMLRSLGFQRSMILGSFFLEATFITLLGIIVGISMGTLGALNEFYIAFSDQPDVKPVFAFKEVFVISAIVYIASIVFSLWPSIKAAKLSPVEATNYPE